MSGLHSAVDGTESVAVVDHPGRFPVGRKDGRRRLASVFRDGVRRCRTPGQRVALAAFIAAADQSALDLEVDHLAHLAGRWGLSRAALADGVDGLLRLGVLELDGDRLRAPRPERTDR